jgi:hypothetical protein
MHALPYEIDCTHCGCADVDVLREPQGEDRWFASGLGRCNNSNCRREFSFREPPEAEHDREEESDSIIEIDPCCPRCGSTEVPVQRSLLPIRYRRCTKCGKRFKGIVKRPERQAR